MCDICNQAAQELKTFMEQLEDKYPGQEIDGIKVSRGHHAFVAVAGEYLVRVLREEEELMELAAQRGPQGLPKNFLQQLDLGDTPIKH